MSRSFLPADNFTLEEYIKSEGNDYPQKETDNDQSFCSAIGSVEDEADDENQDDI